MTPATAASCHCAALAQARTNLRQIPPEEWCDTEISQPRATVTNFKFQLNPSRTQTGPGDSESGCNSVDHGRAGAFPALLSRSGLGGYNRVITAGPVRPEIHTTGNQPWKVRVTLAVPVLPVP